MSTPSTLPPPPPQHNHHHHHHHGFAHRQNYAPPPVASAATKPVFRPLSGFLPSATRPTPSAHAGTRPTGTTDGPEVTTAAASDLDSRSMTTGSRLLGSEQTTLYRPAPMGTNANPSTAMASASSTTVTSAPARKRHRSRDRAPDWENFYKNGLPKEVIVIDDTPPPPATTATTTATFDHAPNGYTTSGAHAAQTRHMAKRRKRESGGSGFEPVDQDAPTSHRPSPKLLASHSGSVSTDRTESANLTTAATSLGSYTSNGQAYEAPEAQPGQKRKRTVTRAQLLHGVKRQAVEDLGDAHPSYNPPPRPPIKAGEVHVKQVHDSAHTAQQVVDDDDGHYIVTPETDLTDRYSVMKLLGQGTFGKVVQARDRRRNHKLVAIKIIRSVQKYRDASRIELRVLSTLKANDPDNRNRCIHLRDCFDYRGHICIVMDLLGQSVFDFLKGNNFVPFPNSQIQSFARQLLTSVAFLHDLNLIHTDLKPENILLCDNAYQAFTYNRRIPSASTNVSRQAPQRKVLLDTEIRLIDFGSATFQEEYHSSVVSTRHYRAPEIILGLGWSFPCDIWSIGCILVEFFTGDALFQTHDNLEHLAMMEAVCGSRISPHLVQQVNAMAKRTSGNPAARFFKRLKLDFPQGDTGRASRKFVKAMKKMKDIIPPTNEFCSLFLDLLQKIFVYDPAERITAKEALKHPWFQEIATADDGTEAIKIRHQRRLEAGELPARRHNGYGHNGYP